MKSSKRTIYRRKELRSKQMTVKKSEIGRPRNQNGMCLSVYYSNYVSNYVSRKKKHYSDESENYSDSSSDSYANSKLSLRSKADVRKQTSTPNADTENSSIDEISESSSSNSNDVNLNNFMKKGMIFLLFRLSLQCFLLN